MDHEVALADRQTEAAQSFVCPQKRTLPLSPSDIRHNLIMLVVIDCLWAFGAAEMQLASGPLYVYLNASNTVIGLIGTSQMLGLVGIFLSPFITRRFPIKKYYLLLVHLPYLAPWGFIGLALILSQHLQLSNAQLLSFIVLMNCLSGFFAGFVTLPHHEYVASCVPMEYRGRLSGYSNSIGAALALLSNALAFHILFNFSKPMAFGWLYVMTWMICQTGYIFALFAREPRTPVENAPRAWSKEMFDSIRQDKIYLRVVGLYSIYNALFLPVIITFISIYGFRDLKMIPATAATVGIVQKIASLSVSAKIGRLIDRLGAQRVLLMAPICLVLTLLPLIVWKSPYAIYMSVATGVTFTVCYNACFNALLFGLPKPENRAGHFTFQNIASYVCLGVGQTIVGGLCDLFGYRPTFMIIALLGIGMIPLSRRILAPLSSN